MTLAQCLDKYGVHPNEIGYSVLKDVALALSYLHQHSPPVIHRDLSANNVLLTPGMTAKISDLGVAKILDLNPSQFRTMTQTPGTLCYMSPESTVPRPHYSTKVDAFSYGVMMVHLFSGQWPFPTEAVIVDPQDDSRVIPQTEADRRQKILDAIGRDHPLMNLILGCLHNSPARRPEAVEILTEVSRVAAQFPSSSGNKVELLQQLTSLRADTDTTRLKQAHEAEIRSLTEGLQQETRSVKMNFLFSYNFICVQMSYWYIAIKLRSQQFEMKLRGALCYLVKFQSDTHSGLSLGHTCSQYFFNIP